LGDMHVETLGSGPRLVLVHGSVGFGRQAWTAQEPLAERYELVVVTRSGYPPDEPRGRLDFEDQADELARLLEPGDHLVAHSYGGVVSLLAAARAGSAPSSLTLLEPPAFEVARGIEAVDQLVADLADFFAGGPHEPAAYAQFFLRSVGSDLPPRRPLSASLDAGARAAMAEQPPWEAEIPLATLAAAGIPTLVVSGAHHAAFDAVCDVLERELHARRAILPGAGHAIARLGEPFNDVLEAFVAGAST
jgi:pimeloyl-ACP methyl ester carboxylesterase